MIGLFIKGMFNRQDGLSPEIRKEIRGAIRDTLKIAPDKLGHVIGLIVQQVMDHRLLPYHFEVIQEQIDECVAGTLRLDSDASAGIPARFHQSLIRVMPMLYDRLSAEIEYKPAVAEAMVDVLKDFLIRWSATFQDFEPHHLVYLNELCDRHVQRWNEKATSSGVTTINADRQLAPDRARSSDFVKGLLVAVEQELRGASRQAAAAAGSGLIILPDR